MKSVKKNVEVILTSTHDHLGTEGEVVRVRSGFARNWLIPKGLAVLANDAYKQMLELSKKRREKRIAEEKKSFQNVATELGSKTWQFKVRVSEAGKLYGAVTPQQIAEELSRQSGKVITKRKIFIARPIKELGSFEAELRLYQGVSTTLKIEVVKDELSAADSKAEAEKQRGRKKKKLDDLVLDAGAIPAAGSAEEADRLAKKRAKANVEETESIAAD